MHPRGATVRQASGTNRPGCLVSRIGQKRQLPRALDRTTEFPLVLAAGTCLTGLADPAALIQVLSDDANVLVVHDEGAPVRAEVTDFLPLASRAATASPDAWASTLRAATGTATRTATRTATGARTAAAAGSSTTATTSTPTTLWSRQLTYPSFTATKLLDRHSIHEGPLRVNTQNRTQGPTGRAFRCARIPVDRSARNRPIPEAKTGPNPTRTLDSGPRTPV